MNPNGFYFEVTKFFWDVDLEFNLVPTLTYPAIAMLVEGFSFFYLFNEVIRDSFLFLLSDFETVRVV